MKQSSSADHMLNEAPPTEAQRNMGMLTAGITALVAVGTVIYWVS
jgi:hypothetical protein